MSEGQQSVNAENGAGYRTVKSVYYTPAGLALAPRYAHLEDAVASMGEGVVVAEEDGHVAAFHEKHLRFVEHALTRVTSPARGGQRVGDHVE